MFQDHVDVVIERAISYTIPYDKDLPPMYFPLICNFGMKRPIFSVFHLSLCDDKTLLILSDENVIKLLLLHKYEDEIFHVSLQVIDYFYDGFTLVLFIISFQAFHQYN